MHDMGVAIDQSGGHEAAFQIDEFGLGIVAPKLRFAGQRADAPIDRGDAVVAGLQARRAGARTHAQDAPAREYLDRGRGAGAGHRGRGGGRCLHELHKWVFVAGHR
jgi:hypothetical protein